MKSIYREGPCLPKAAQALFRSVSPWTLVNNNWRKFVVNLLLRLDSVFLMQSRDSRLCIAFGLTEDLLGNEGKAIRTVHSDPSTGG